MTQIAPFSRPVNRTIRTTGPYEQAEFTHLMASLIARDEHGQRRNQWNGASPVQSEKKTHPPTGYAKRRKAFT